MSSVKAMSIATPKTACTTIAVFGYRPSKYKMLEYSASSRRRKGVRSGNDLVSAVLGHQNFGIGGVSLDLLAQTIHMRFERMRRHSGIITPDLFQQDVAGNDGAPGAVQITDDRRFLFRQPDFLPSSVVSSFWLGLN